jgi:hypothetical protein
MAISWSEPVAVAAITQAKARLKQVTLEAAWPSTTDVDGAFWRWNDVWLSKISARSTFALNAEHLLSAPVDSGDERINTAHDVAVNELASWPASGAVPLSRVQSLSATR